MGIHRLCPRHHPPERPGALLREGDRVNELERRRELARLSKPELINMVMDAERTFVELAPAEHEIRRQS